MNKVIVIDGTYGIGKTTVAQCMCGFLNPRFACIDPDEMFNNNLERYFPYGWPTANNKAILVTTRKEAGKIIKESNIAIPITLNSSEYKQVWLDMLQDLAEIIHVVLLAEKGQIQNRINNDLKRDKSFAMERLDDNMEYYQGAITGAIKIETSNKTPCEVANLIFEII